MRKDSESGGVLDGGLQPSRILVPSCIKKSMIGEGLTLRLLSTRKRVLVVQ